MQPTATTNDGKNENIEILRAIAILFVLTVHTEWCLIFPSNLYVRFKSVFDGNIGVDLFFVISGFVIARSLSNSFRTGGSNNLPILVAFWIRRIFRLLPAAVFWLFIAFVYQLGLGFYGNTHDFFFRNLIPMAAALGNVLNLQQAYCAANPSDPIWCGIYCFFGHYWSLSFEQQFYIVLPLLFCWLTRRRIAILAVLLIAGVFFWQRPYWSYGWFFRVDGFCWGVLLALLSLVKVQMKGIDRLLARTIVCSGLTYSLILWLPILSSRLQGFGKDAASYGIALLALVSAAILWLAVRYENNLGTWLPYRRVMLYIGSRSYSIYIIHLIAFEIMKHGWLTHMNTTHFSVFEKRLTNAVVVGSSLIIVSILAELTYRFIEYPFRRWGKELSRNIFEKKANIDGQIKPFRL